METDPEIQEWEEFLREKEEIEEFINSRVDVEDLLESGDDYALIKYSQPEEIVELMDRDIEYMKKLSQLSISRRAIYLKDIVPNIGGARPMPPEVYRGYNELTSFVKKHNNTVRRRVYSRTRALDRGSIAASLPTPETVDETVENTGKAGGTFLKSERVAGMVISGLSVLMYLFSSIR